MKSSNLEYSDPEYSDPEFLVFEFENDYKKNFNNEEIELNEEEVSQLIYEYSSFYDLQWDNKASSGQLPYYSGEIKNEMSDSDISDSDIGNNTSISEPLNKLNNKLKDMKNMNAYEYLHFLAVHKYLTAIFNHKELYSCIDLSFEISQQVFQHGPWIARHIRERITAKRFHNYVQNNILPHITSSRTSTSLETTQTWLHRLSLVYKPHQQSVY
ncbi:hypothetical protein F8M41_012011 [Gigaspora margarita]|uniref:Uncharacterized protein n=1 Tax=Gigaspora margarita TaxID=4874 RepID=A0A8H3X044_GIGMA|nr:hypothetical protein F8M41_012011 [Gigaspora margarita]